VAILLTCSVRDSQFLVPDQSIVSKRNSGSELEVYEFNFPEYAKEDDSIEAHTVA